jgi:2'-5' RNA ligase
MQAALADAVTAIVREAKEAGGGTHSVPGSGVRPVGSSLSSGERSGVRSVPAKNFHLTLAFLGAVPRSRFEALSQVATQVAQAFGSRDDLPIEVTLDTVEHWRKPQILCATASETPPVAIALAEALTQALMAENFVPDLKPFRAHATFARKVRRVTRELRIEPVRWSFRDFHLIESRTAHEASAYSTVEKWVLDKRLR